DSGQEVHDLSGRGYNGSLGSSSGSDSKDPVQGVEGILGTTGYQFDGSNDQVLLSNKELLNLGDRAALTAWVNFVGCE
ncbi:MAG: hypothetical protein ABEI52_08730, partial [Halobacteriaceae archaeon]